MKIAIWKDKKHVEKYEGRAQCGSKIPELATSEGEYKEVCKTCFPNGDKMAHKKWRCPKCGNLHAMYKVFCLPRCLTRNEELMKMLRD